MRGGFFYKLRNTDIVNPDKFIFIQKLQARVSRCCLSQLLKRLWQMYDMRNKLGKFIFGAVISQLEDFTVCRRWFSHTIIR